MKKIWICGQLKGEWIIGNTPWEFQGAFSTIEKADKACLNESYFIFPGKLDEALPEDACMLESCIYPRIEECLDTQDEQPNKELQKKYGYHDVYTCPECGGSNIITNQDSVATILVEADTECSSCGQKNHWDTGFYSTEEPS